jgi:hypothetical protein
MHSPFALNLQVPVRPPAESDDRYPVVAQLNERWRVIVCRDGIQWILQRKQALGATETYAASDWRGRSYCRTSSTLVRCCREHCGPIEPAAATVLAALPDRIGGGR